MIDINSIEKIIGYSFKDKSLIVKALTHPSYAHEHNVESYQNMEFLGDSILNFIVAERLIKLYPMADEGRLTKYRANIVSKEPLADVIDSHHLDSFILSGSYTNLSRKTRSDVFESIVAAIYYDSGITEARKFILRFLDNMMKGRRIDYDYKSKLYELAAKMNFQMEFILKDTSGQQHNPLFSYEVIIDGEVMGKGEDKSKKSAQQEAARQALKNLERK